jgi:hypothetical protein
MGEGGGAIGGVLQIMVKREHERERESAESRQTM